MIEVNAIEHHFLEMLARIREEGVATEEDRRSLWTAITTGGMAVERVDALLVEFMKETYEGFAADGQVSDDERKKLRILVDALAISEEHLPESVRQALREVT